AVFEPSPDDAFAIEAVARKQAVKTKLVLVRNTESMGWPWFFNNLCDVCRSYIYIWFSAIGLVYSQIPYLFSSLAS
ncbi:MAG: hypothetical protein AB3N12_10875, partial [Ruegeria sp.]